MNTWISVPAGTALDTLVNRYGVTRRAVIEALLLLEGYDPNSKKNKNLIGKNIPAKPKLLRNETTLDSYFAARAKNKLLRNGDGAASPRLQETPPDSAETPAADQLGLDF